MSSEKLVHPLFGLMAISLSLFFIAKENTALAGKSTDSSYIVVIDPGHGGSDTGATGKVGSIRFSEKELALDISLRLERLLSDPQYWKPLGHPIKISLTRRRDQYVSLEKRSETARIAKADLFLSIHANSDPQEKADGLETYFLNNTDETSSLKLQEIENRTSLRRKGKDSDLQDLLLRSISTDAAVEDSRQAAELIHSSLSSHLRSRDLEFHDRGVRQALFYVLLDSRVPSALVECFFLSSNADLKLIAATETREQIAEGLARGILRYLAVK